MPRQVMRDKSMERVDAAARKASLGGRGSSGTAGGALKDVRFTPGESETYHKGRSRK